MRYIVNQYNSVTDFIKSVNAAKTNKVFASEEKYGTLSSQRIEKDKDFAGTENYNEANDLFRYGDKDNAKRMDAAGLDVRKANANGNSTRAKNFNSVVGFCPNVPAYLMGLPTNMMNQKKQVFKTSKVLTVVYNISYPWYVTTDSVASVNARFVNAILAFESKGYRINLFVTWASGKGHELAMPVIKIKDSGTKFDKLKLAYPLMNPSFSRRHCFRYLETCDIHEDRYTYGYGSAVNDVEKIGKALKANHLQFDKVISFMDIRDHGYSSQQIIDNYFAKK